MPWWVASIADERLPRSTRLDLACKLVSLPFESLGRFARQVRSACGRDPSMLLQNTWQQILRKWAELHTLHTQDIESLHALLRRLINSQSCFASVLSRGCLKQAQIIAKETQASSAETLPSAALPAQLKDLRKEKRAVKSLESWWFNMCRRRNRDLGRAKGRITSEDWASARKEWDVLADADRRAYTLMHKEEMGLAYAFHRAPALAPASAAPPLPLQDALPGDAQPIIAHHARQDCKHWANDGHSVYQIAADGGTIALSSSIMMAHRTTWKGMSTKRRETSRIM